MTKKKKDINDILVESLTKTIKEEGLSKESMDEAIRLVTSTYISDNEQEFKDAVIKEALMDIKIPKVIEIKTPKGKKKQISHFQFDNLVKAIQSNLPILIVGMPGTGKTSSVEQVSKVLEIAFNAISVGIQTTKSDILGFVDANGNYKSTGFRESFENGGVFLMDEIDAGNPNVLIVVNSAISNGFCSFPDKMVYAHENFRFVATANTFGNGADTRFVGRNQLDAATLDRFITIDFLIDEALEKIICGNDEWLEKVRNLRKECEENNRDIVVSPRVSIYGAKLIQAGFSVYEAAEMTIMKGHDEDTVAFIKKGLGIRKPSTKVATTGEVKVEVEEDVLPW